MSLQENVIYNRTKAALEYKINLLNSTNKMESRMRDSEMRRFTAKYHSIYKTRCPVGCDELSAEDNRLMYNDEIEAGYKEIVNLLFTKGEIDTDKIICLHALTSHPCETLKPATPTNKTHNNREPSALDRLIERSRSFCGYRCGVHNYLPIYILNLNPKKIRPSTTLGYNQSFYSNNCCIRDGRLATRLVINDNISRLVNSVLEALQHCNPRKMLKLLHKANNPHRVKEIITKNELQEFLKSLSFNNFMLSSDSFLLTRPFEQCTQLNIERPSLSLQKVIQNIRCSVLNDPDKLSRYINKMKASISNQEFKEKGSEIKGVGKLQENQENSVTCSDFNAAKMAELLNDKVREAHDRDMKKLKRILMRNNSKKKHNKKKTKFFN